ncbi:hypothetical protein BDQ17DRAFT_1356812 [Cyathus striatus]|nr:hypothetical protein BDQ17DRAFT_1356812 [Cyathus striatus]
MPLSKRKRDGEFELWTPSSCTAGASGSGVASGKTDVAPSAGKQNIEAPAVLKDSQYDEPPAKRTRTRTGTISRPRKATTATTTTNAKGKGKAKAVSPPAATSSTLAAGPSTSAVPASPPAKRSRKKAKDVDSGQPEKRLAMFKPKCPQNIMDRVHRVMTQRIFMISRHREGSELKETFQVLGSTGNVYTVTIDHKPRCDCPDAYKGNHCKHIVLLQVSQDSNLWYQKALLTSELEQIFANAPLAPNSLANPKIREAYARATGQAPPSSEEEEEQEHGKRKIPGEDDDCPICYDSMHGAKEDKLAWCEECGNAIHKECWDQWKRTSQSQGKPLTCVWCRATWPADNGVGTPKKSGHYLNFASVAGISPVRDTSTYYHGPRAGHRYYGYREYDD